jgi:hypothetical protein
MQGSWRVTIGGLCLLLLILGASGLGLAAVAARADAPVVLNDLVVVPDPPVAETTTPIDTPTPLPTPVPYNSATPGPSPTFAVILPLTGGGGDNIRTVALSYPPHLVTNLSRWVDFTVLAPDLQAPAPGGGNAQSQATLPLPRSPGLGYTPYMTVTLESNGPLTTVLTGTHPLRQRVAGGENRWTWLITAPITGTFEIWPDVTLMYEDAAGHAVPTDLDNSPTTHVQVTVTTPPPADPLNGVLTNPVANTLELGIGLPGLLLTAGPPIWRRLRRRQPVPPGAGGSTPPDPGYPLPPALRQDLVTALLDLPNIDDEATRAALLVDLPAALRHAIPRDASPRNDLEAIVTTCCAWDAAGTALHTLIATAQTVAPGSTADTALAAVTARLRGAAPPA